MKFRIVGADRETGEDVEIIVDARDEVDAETIASRRNIMVSSVVLVRSPPPEPQQFPPITVKKNVKQCPKCKEWINKGATKCPHCCSTQPAPPWVYAIVALVLIGPALWCCGPCSVFDSPDAKPAAQEREHYGNNTEFEQVGYFKNNAKNRIFTIAYKPDTTEHEIRAYAEGLMYTSGRMMAAYFYPEGSLIPADGITLAGSVFEANDVLYESPGLSKWRYAYMKGFRGTSEFVDCERDPDNDLCRKK